MAPNSSGLNDSDYKIQRVTQQFVYESQVNNIAVIKQHWFKFGKTVIQHLGERTRAQQ